MNDLLEKQINLFNIDELITKTNELDINLFRLINIDNLFVDIINGNFSNIFRLDNFIDLFKEEVLVNLQSITTIILIIIVHSIFKIVSDNLESNVGKIAYYIQYLLISIILIDNITTILGLLKSCIVQIVDFMNLLIPFFITLLITTGNVSTTTIVQPIIIIFINLIR